MTRADDHWAAAEPTRMFDHLQIDDRRERWLVGCADAALKPLGDIAGWRRSAAAVPPQRVLLFRLERIGDLLMTLEAVATVRRLLPDAELRLVVGSWNADLARLIPGVDQVDTLDMPWLAREGTGSRLATVVRRIARWRRHGFDLAINFEPDIRSNALAAACGAPRRVGFDSKGGAAFLTDALRYDPTLHCAANAARLVDRAIPIRDAGPPRGAAGPALRISGRAHARAARLLAARAGTGPLVGLNPGAGRAIKQWPGQRFARAAEELAAQVDATIVLLGSTAERAPAEAVRRALPTHVRLIDLVGQTSLTHLAAVLTRLSVLITGDTGTMHLAAAVDTPIVAVFGLTDPGRFGPLTPRAIVVQGDLWCRPCGRDRRPPRRCAGGTPDCLTAVSTDDVVDAARRVLRA